MEETKSIKFSDKTIKKIILLYYKKYLNDINIKINYELIEESDYSNARMKITIEKKIKIGEYDALSKYTLSDEDIMSVINDELNKYGYKSKYNQIFYDIVGYNWHGINVYLEKIQEHKKTLRKE